MVGGGSKTTKKYDLGQKEINIGNENPSGTITWNVADVGLTNFADFSEENFIDQIPIMDLKLACSDSTSGHMASMIFSVIERTYDPATGNYSVKYKCTKRNSWTSIIKINAFLVFI